MVSNELNQLLKGESRYVREQAPEPLLLPRIASRITPEGLRSTASAAVMLSGYWAPFGWPALAEATAQAIALRHSELTDNLLMELCDTLPQLPISLIGLDEAAGQRVETIIGTDSAIRLRAGLGDPTCFLREAAGRLLSISEPPHTADELMELIRERTEFESPERQRNLLAYFLPLAPVAHHQWMIPILVNVLGINPGWTAAVAASRVAGLLDQTAIEQADASLETLDSPWTQHVRGLLAEKKAGSVFLEVARALPYDRRFESLLASEAELASLTDFIDEIMHLGPVLMAGPPDQDYFESDDDYPEEESPPKMAGSRGMDPFESGDDDGAEQTGADEPWPAMAAPPAVELSDLSDDDDLEEASPERSSGSRSMPAPAPAPDPSSERRLQAQVFADDDGVLLPVREGFRSGTRHDVRLWIGPKTKHGISADAVINEPSPDAQELQTGSMEINITLVSDSKFQVGKVDLPVDRAKRSTVAEFSLDVERDAPFVSAEVWLQHKGRILQYLKLNGLTLEDPDNTTDGIALRVETLIRGLPVDASGGEFEMAMVKKDNQYIVFGPRGAEKTEVSLQGSGEFVESINERLFNATKGLVRHSADMKGTSWVGDHDEEAMQLLREMARWGNALYDTLKKEGVLERISETIQFVNLDESDIVPVEYVYDKGYPKDGATLCDGFREAKDWSAIFATGKCSCSNQPLVKSDTLCPMGFWSLSKVIDRQSRPRGMAKGQSANDFTEPTAESPGISLTRQVVLAAAPNVKDLDVSSIKSMLDETYPGRNRLATDWQEWETEIEEKSPNLLILLPHHGEAAQGHTDFLEIGSPGQTQGDRLYAGLLSGDYVTNKFNEPGPVVLLLGCKTAQADRLPFHTFARDFLANRASIVVATQASVLGQHAAPVANEFIRQLLVSTQKDGSFGKIMRDVRQKMFAGGYLMSLALVSFGDSDWKLGNSTTGENDVPH